MTGPKLIELEKSEYGWREPDPSPSDRAPDPLPDDMPAVAAFDCEMLPAGLRDWVGDVADRIQCPADYPAVGAMVAVASIVGRKIGIRPKRRDDWTVVPNLWGGIVGRPGTLKTPALSEPMKMLNELEAKARRDHENEMLAFNAGELVRRVEAKETEAALKKSSGAERLKLAMAAVESADEKQPPRKRYHTSDVTVEKLGELLRDNPNGLLVFRDELVGWLSSLDREGREGSRAFFLEAWNGSGRYTFDRIGRGTIEIEAACVSILGGIQPGPLTDYLIAARRGGKGDDGLIQRFQLLVWPDVVGRWRNVDTWPNSEARRRAREIVNRLDTLDPAALGAHQDDGDPIPWVRFSDSAQAVFDSWRETLELKLRAGDLPPAFEAHLAKYRSLMPTLALICHLIDDPAGGPVGEASTLRAAAWCEYLETHARRVYSPALDPALTAARELDRRLLRGDLPDSFTLRDVYRKKWHLLDRQGAELALDYLSAGGRIIERAVATGGRPVIEYRLNPALGG